MSIDTTFVERRQGERRRFAYPPTPREAEGMRVSWGGIWGGVLIAMGILLLSAAVGFAVGMSSAVSVSGSVETDLGTGIGIWGAVSLLVALFLGGMAATRIGMVTDKATGAIQGALVWVVSVLFLIVLAGGGFGLIADIGFSFSDSHVAAWIGVAAMVISLLAAILGALAGRRRAAVRTGIE
jgi:hypothetical protein